jgi:hypothetical protein
VLRTWTERGHHQAVYWNEVDKGGKFAAREWPERFSAEKPGRVPITALIGARTATPHAATLV